MLNFCTLFNSNYLSRGLALYNSLISQISNFHLYIFSFDEKTYQILNLMKLDHVTIVSLNQLESKDLLEVKSKRTEGEYCWTCTPAVIKYSIEKFNLDHCTYLDADLYFFNDPKILINELIRFKKDVLITPHNYTWLFNQSKTSGVFCVQFMYFKNTHESMSVLNEWYLQCIEWCYARTEDGKFGDQKYLDVWPKKYDCVHVLNHLGTLAPWNVNSIPIENIVFYHFHGYKIIGKNKYFYGWYPLSKKIQKLIYNTYNKEIKKIEIDLNNKFNFHTQFDPTPLNLGTFKSWIKYKVAQLLIFFRKSRS